MITRVKQFNANLLQVYMILALLFLTSVTLHIHTQEVAVSEDHGAAVSISSISGGDFSHNTSLGEIVVSPDSAIKLEHDDVPVFAVYLLIAIIVAHRCQTYIGRLRYKHSLNPVVPFFGAPLLRAPPL